MNSRPDSYSISKVIQIGSFQCFIQARVASACTLFKGEAGEPLAAVAGGSISYGMEVWNPRDGNVQQVSKMLPTEEADNFPTGYAQLVSINVVLKSISFSFVKFSL